MSKMANYVEYIKVGNGETWPIRDKETAEALHTLQEQMNTALRNILLNAHPVGSYYISGNDTSPADLFGGTWVRIKDTFLLAAGDKYTAGSTGGEEKHTLTANEMPSHGHGVMAEYGVDGNINYAPANDGKFMQLAGTSAGTKQPISSVIASTGGGQPHNNMPPYLTVYVWKRTE